VFLLLVDRDRLRPLPLAAWGSVYGPVGLGPGVTVFNL